MGTIDVHAHMVPAEFPPTPCDCARWPSLRPTGDVSAMVYFGEEAFRTIDHRAWSAARRLEDMDAQDVDIQVLSPMPELLSYWLELAPALDLCRVVNETTARMVSEAPTRFLGLGIVPLQEPEVAAREVERVRALGLVGIEIGSNILGRAPGDPRFDPFYAAAERAGMAIFVHALHPIGNERLVGPALLAPFIGFPTDTGLAAASFITGRTLERFPRLRVAFSHGGGTLAALLYRLRVGRGIMPGLAGAFGDPVDEARRFYYDNIVFDARLLRFLVETFGETQLLAGSDYPFVAGQSHPAQPFSEITNDDRKLALFFRRNAERFLDLAASAW